MHRSRIPSCFTPREEAWMFSRSGSKPLEQLLQEAAGAADGFDEAACTRQLSHNLEVAPLTPKERAEVQKLKESARKTRSKSRKHRSEPVHACALEESQIVDVQHTNRKKRRKQSMQVSRLLSVVEKIAYEPTSMTVDESMCEEPSTTPKISRLQRSLSSKENDASVAAAINVRPAADRQRTKLMTTKIKAPTIRRRKSRDFLRDIQDVESSFQLTTPTKPSKSTTPTSKRKPVSHSPSVAF